MQRFAALFAPLVLVTVTGCSSTPEKGSEPPPQSAAAPEPPKKPKRSAADRDFDDAVGDFYVAYLAANPARAVELGFHEYDGRVPDVSPAAIKKEREWLAASEATFRAFDAAKLSPRRQVEREILLANIGQARFMYRELDVVHRYPLAYHLDVSPYISRPYAPESERARAIIRIAEKSAGYYAQAQANLDEVLPRPWVQTAILQTRGTITFLKDDVPKAFTELDVKTLTLLRAQLSEMAEVLTAHATFLERRLEKADNNFALGEAKFLKMLRAVNGLETDLGTLKQVAERDLERNSAAMVAAAKAIDPEASTADVVARVLADKPPRDGVLKEATTQCVALKAHLVERDLVTIPSNDVAKVTVTPPFLRYNFAFLDGAGPFEKKRLPSFYYITPPDPTWPEDKQLAYIPGKTDLLGTSIHEVWPGHFLHALHLKKNPSKVMKSFWNYAMGEGWAHYTEEMMITDGGFGDGAPEFRVGQLVNALLRNVRFLSAIGLHAEGMTVEESTRLFQLRAYQDEGNAVQQAVRGTFDPMYLSYTVGKLMIMKLRDDYQARQGAGFSLKAFHDEFLAYGAAPVPVIRRAMLGADAGPAL